uniref:Uncharacterized protein n=1 Tax=Moniliophthora roreri TaxID=221103 RepID=A0A0W0F4F5_MONRR
MGSRRRNHAVNWVVSWSLKETMHDTLAPEERVNVMKVWVVGLLELGRGLELGKTVLSAQILP